MSDGDDDGHEDGGDHGSSFMQLPIGDLFLALGSAFLVALLLAQGMRAQAVSPPADDHAAMRVVATETGLILPDDPRSVASGSGNQMPADQAAGPPAAAGRRGQGTVIGLDEVPTRADLAAQLRQATQAQRPVLLIVAEHGGESAFLFEGVAHAAGVSHLLRLRLDRDCRFSPSPLPAEACRALVSRLASGA